MISEDTRLLVGDEFLTRPLDLVAVKGKTKPVCVYEVITEMSAATEHEKHAAVLFESGSSVVMGAARALAR